MNFSEIKLENLFIFIFSGGEIIESEEQQLYEHLHRSAGIGRADRSMTPTATAWDQRNKMNSASAARQQHQIKKQSKL